MWINKLFSRKFNTQNYLWNCTPYRLSRGSPTARTNNNLSLMYLLLINTNTSENQGENTSSTARHWCESHCGHIIIVYFTFDKWASKRLSNAIRLIDVVSRIGYFGWPPFVAGGSSFLLPKNFSQNVDKRYSINWSIGWFDNLIIWVENGDAKVPSIFRRRQIKPASNHYLRYSEVHLTSLLKSIYDEIALCFDIN